MAALACCPATHPRHRRACPCIVAAKRVGKMRMRWPRHRRSRRVAPLSAGRVGEATHPGLAYTKHLRCPHYPTWLPLPCSRFLFALRSSGTESPEHPICFGTASFYNSSVKKLHCFFGRAIIALLRFTNPVQNRTFFPST